MGSFANKLARLSASRPTLQPAETAPSARATTDKPSLDELRERIARIVGRTAAPTPRADPTISSLPFVVEPTDHGPRYVRRLRSLPAARVGRAPLHAARSADPAMLALLALDPALATCDPRRALYVDTETTGLAGGTGTVPFLLGLAWFDDAANAFVLEQVLLRRLGEEAPILTLFAERVAEASMLVTYNGKAFDMPLLRTRYLMNRLAAPTEPPHLDLVHLVRRLHGFRLKIRTLGAIEHHVLGRVRIDDVPGGEVVQRYAHFLRTGDEDALLGVVEHNAADVLSMVALVGLYGEPIGGLEGVDLAGAARVARRAGDLASAELFAEHAVARGGGRIALHARGDVAKARGDRARALLDYESVLAATEPEGIAVDDASVRLELAKIYEHHVKSFAHALSLLDLGTGEADAQTEKRRARLQKKLARA